MGTCASVRPAQFKKQKSRKYFLSEKKAVHNFGSCIFSMFLNTVCPCILSNHSEHPEYSTKLVGYFYSTVY